MGRQSNVVMEVVLKTTARNSPVSSTLAFPAFIKKQKRLPKL